MVSVIRGGLEHIDSLEPLWRALYEHHAEVAGAVVPVREYAETWRRRRAQYQEWLGGGDGVLLLAQRDGRAIGYAMVRPGPGATTWDLGERGLEIETLSVLASERRAGVGHKLIEAAEEVARETECEFIDLGLVYINEDAERFYKREGFRRFYISMVRKVNG